jgi:DNA topoisomerase-1
MPRRGSGACAEAAVSDIATRAALGCATVQPCSASARWPCRRPTTRCGSARAHARGRKQYRYHPNFRALREANKFDRLLAFGRVLPRLRALVQADLSAVPPQGPPQQQGVIAAIVRLLDATFVRVGNDEYARSNGSFG